MAVINYNQKWLYLMEPHTASRAVTEFLKKNMQGAEVGHHHASVAELTDPRRRQISKRADVFDIICTVRNPFDVLVTRWLFRNPEPLDYESICDVAHAMNLTTQEIEESDLPHTLAFSEWAMRYIENSATDPLKGLWKDCTKFIHYEWLDADLSEYFGTPVELPTNPKHITEDKLEYRAYYQDQDDLVAALTLKYEAYLRQFGYNVQYEHGNLDVHLEGIAC